MEIGKGGARRSANPKRLIPTIPAIAPTLLCVVTQLSPLQAQTIHQNTDNFFGSTVYSTEQRYVDLDGSSSGASWSVNFQFIADKPVPNSEFPYVLVVHTQTPEPIFIQQRPTLLLKLDGAEPMLLTGSGGDNARDVGVNVNVAEGTYYALTPEKLRRIAAAKSVEFGIVGDWQTITGTWRADLLADAAAFAAQGPQLLEISTSSPVKNTAAAISPKANQAHPVLGVGFVDVSPQQAASMKLVRPQGVLVLDVTPGSIASKAGIRAGDVILEFGSLPIAKATALQDAVAKMQPGQHVEVKIWRGEPSTLDIQF
jgi:hypothetical protein